MFFRYVKVCKKDGMVLTIALKSYTFIYHIINIMLSIAFKSKGEFVVLSLFYCYLPPPEFTASIFCFNSLALALFSAACAGSDFAR